MPLNQGLQTEYIVGRDVTDNHYHVEVVRSALTRSLVARFSDIRDEIVAAFNDNIPSKPGGRVAQRYAKRLANRFLRMGFSIRIGDSHASCVPNQ